MSSRAVYKDTNNPYAERFGYSRAIRRGPFISVAGTTSINPETGKLEHAGSAYEQAKYAFEQSVEAIGKVNDSPDTGAGEGAVKMVTRVKMFVKHASDCDSVGLAMRDVLKGGEYVATMIVGAQFIQEDMLVEVEVDAIIGYS